MDSDFRTRLVGHRHAFTLVELLVVIGIISILMGLLFPAFRRVRMQSQLTICKSNMRQIHLGLVMYSQDYRDHWPDPETTGYYNFRMAPGLRTVGVPSAIPETRGLAAVLHGITPNDDLSKGMPKYKYIDGQSGVWLCPSQPQPWMTDYKNTYSFSIAIALGYFLSKDRARGPDDLMLWDNWTQYPGLSGFSGPFSGYNIPSNKQVVTHPRSGGTARGSVVELHFNGAIVVRDIK